MYIASADKAQGPQKDASRPVALYLRDSLAELYGQVECTAKVRVRQASTTEVLKRRSKVTEPLCLG